MPINVSIKTRPGRKDYAFTWVATSDEARSLWDRCEEMATEQGHEAHEIASGVINSFTRRANPRARTRGAALRFGSSMRCCATPLIISILPAWSITPEL